MVTVAASKDLGVWMSRNWPILACLFHYFFFLHIRLLNKNRTKMFYFPDWIIIKHRWPSWQSRGRGRPFFFFFSLSESPSDPIWLASTITDAWKTALSASVMRSCCWFPLSFYALENQGGSNHREMQRYPGTVSSAERTGMVRSNWGERLCCLPALSWKIIMPTWDEVAPEGVQSTSSAAAHMQQPASVNLAAHVLRPWAHVHFCR